MTSASNKRLRLTPTPSPTRLSRFLTCCQLSPMVLRLLRRLPPRLTPLRPLDVGLVRRHRLHRRRLRGRRPRRRVQRPPMTVCTWRGESAQGKVDQQQYWHIAKLPRAHPLQLIRSSGTWSIDTGLTRTSPEGRGVGWHCEPCRKDRDELRAPFDAVSFSAGGRGSRAL